MRCAPYAADKRDGQTRMLYVILEVVLALAIVGAIIFWIARPPKK